SCDGAVSGESPSSVSTGAVDRRADGAVLGGADGGGGAGRTAQPVNATLYAIITQGATGGLMPCSRTAGRGRFFESPAAPLSRKWWKRRHGSLHRPDCSRRRVSAGP